MAANFSNILLNANLGDVEKPKPIPAGSYVAIIKGNVELAETKSENKTQYVRITLEPVQALEDVNPAELEAFGKLEGKKVRVDFFITEAALFRLQDFILDHCGLEQLRGVSIEQALEQLPNNTVGITIGHRVDDRKPDVVYAEVTKTFRAA